MQRGSSPSVARERRALSTGTAARIVGVHPTTILRAIQAGELPAIRLGPHGHHRIRPEALEAWARPTTAEEDDGR